MRLSPASWNLAVKTLSAFWGYRQDGGARESLLPDSCIGVHAAIAGTSLLSS